MQIIVPEVDRLDLETLLDGHEIVSSWQQARSAERLAVNIVVQAAAAEPIMDRIEQRFGSVAGFRLLLYPLEAVLPRPVEEEMQAAPAPAAKESSPSRVSREELHNNITESLGTVRIHAVMTALSVIVAAIGLLRDDLAVIIAAMVIAPLLGPNVALALATTLADAELAGKALERALLGFVIALGLALAIGWWFPVDAELPAIAARTQVALSDLALALAAGAAGALAFTSGASSALIGVMVAVALVPPLVVFGMLLGSGQIQVALGAGLLVLANLVCVNLAGIATFLAQGVRPRRWWDAVRASRMARLGLIVWLLLLASLSALLLFSRYR
jgi:uncharacterized hydrophobic protein (TIGR00341 family)